MNETRQAMSNRVLIKAPAKINLTLDVMGQRADGYHELETVMHQVDLCDRVYVEREPEGIILATDNPVIPVDQSNLASRAAALILERYAIKSGVKIFLEKNIPVEAGLAGGSVDAAAVLTAVNDIFDLRLNREELQELGAELGSDVPFCLAGGTALCTGRGELVKLLPEGPELNLLLIKPPFSLATADIYRHYRPERVGKRPRLELFLAAWQRCDMMEVARQMNNVLESVSIPMKPEIQTIKESAVRLGAIAAIMSGSGPTVAAVFTSQIEAENAARQMRLLYRECYVVKSIKK